MTSVRSSMTASSSAVRCSGVWSVLCVGRMTGQVRGLRSGVELRYKSMRLFHRVAGSIQCSRGQTNKQTPFYEPHSEHRTSRRRVSPGSDRGFADTIQSEDKHHALT